MEKKKKFHPFVSHSAVDGLSVLLVFILLSLTAGDSGRLLGTLSLAVLSVSGVILGMFLFRLYRMWLLISDPPKGITPKKAAGLMLIPVFNFYWAYIAVKGLADNINILLEKSNVPGRRISESLSVAFSIIFPFTFLSLIFARGEILFFALFLAMLFVMRRLVWDWRHAEWLLAGNIDESKQAVSVVKTNLSRNIIRTVGIVIGTIILSAFIVVWYCASFIVPFSGYKERAYKHALRLDLKNAHTAAEAYFGKHPKFMIKSETDLVRLGWSRSPDIEFISSTLTIKSGEIVLRHTKLDKEKYTSDQGLIDHAGNMVLPQSK